MNHGAQAAPADAAHRPSSPVTSTVSQTGPGAVMAEVCAHGGLTTRELIAITGFARATVEARVARLLDAGFLVPELVHVTAGRPPRRYLPNDAGARLLAINVGARRTRVRLTDLACRPLAETQIEVAAASGPGAVLGAAASTMRALLVETGSDAIQVFGVGIGVPSAVEVSGEMARPPAESHPGLSTAWTDVRISREVAAFLPALGIRNVPVVVDDSANCKAVGEWLSSWPQVSDLLAIGLGDSVSCGVVSGGHVLRGSHGLAGDIAHIPDDRFIELCTCGNTGCAAAVISGTALASALGVDTVSAEMLSAADDGISPATALLDRAAERLTLLVAGAVSTLNPSVVALGGSLAPAYASRLDQIRRGVRRRVHPRAADVTITLAPVDSGAGLAGAAQRARAAALDPAVLDAALDTGIILPTNFV